MDEQAGKPSIVAGERPLTGFISSVMRPELQWARDAAVDALTRNRTLVPWAFEYTPASSDSAVSSYLTKVRESDFVIWLVAEETTGPVRDEIAEALASNRRIWAITLPADRRDSLTTQLLNDVRGRSKTASVSTEDDLRELLALTFSDEVIRALRDTPGLTRLALIEQLGRRSRERMINRWVAVGLPRAEAITLADNPAIGEPPPSVLPDSAEPLRVVAGEMGIGKSVVAERALQLALSEARERAGARIPIFVHARDAVGGLESAIVSRCAELGDPRVQGVSTVVDGLDEVASDTAARLVEEARELARALPDSRILITSRPTAALRRSVPERVMLPLLTEEEARALVGLVWGREVSIGMEGGWPESVRDAVRRPLFAILLGLNRRRGEDEPMTTGELLGTLVEQSIEVESTSAAFPWLRRLAIAVIDSGGPVDLAEIGDAEGRHAVGSSRLVFEENHLIDFSLPILAQWFGSEALISGDVRVADVCGDPRRLDRWRYPLAIALTNGPRAFIDDSMACLVQEQPGFAAELVEESFHRWGRGAAASATTPTAVEAGTALRRAIEAWANATQPISNLAVPRKADGHLLPIAASPSTGFLSFGWYLGNSEAADVLQLPASASVLTQTRDWHVQRHGSWNNEKGWAWRWALELLRDGVENALGHRALSNDDPGLLAEGLWATALACTGREGRLTYEPILLDTVEQALKGIETPLIQLRDRRVSTDAMRREVGLQREKGATEVRSPWPEPDLERAPDSGTSWIWDPYSPEQQRERVEAIYGAALVAYAALVDKWFPSLKTRMRIAATLPATLRGTLTPSQPSPVNLSAPHEIRMPTMSWYLDPLALGEPSRAVVQLANSEDDPPKQRHDEWRAELTARQEKIVRLRPQAAGWISTIDTYGIADVFQIAPLVELVYDWIKDDLRAINWQ
jgi:hypothetical protein